MQSFNLEGIKFFFEILRNPALAIPQFEVLDIRSLSPRALDEAGIEGVIFDKDNTITDPYSLDVNPQIEKALDRFRLCFDNRLAILSNSAGTMDDKRYEKAVRIEDALGIEVIRHNDKKPGGINAVRRFFGCDPSKLVMIGDRYFTDVAYGNRYGMLTVRVQPFTEMGDNSAVKMIARPLENSLVGRWKARGVMAPKHECYRPQIWKS